MPSDTQKSSRLSLDELDLTISQLSQQVQSLTSAVDAVRDDLQWVSQNGLPPYAPSIRSNGNYSQLKGMSADLTSSSWSESLDIRLGASAIIQQRIDVAQSDLARQLRSLVISLLKCPELKTANLDERTGEVIQRAQHVVELTDAETGIEAQAEFRTELEAQSDTSVSTSSNGKLF